MSESYEDDVDYKIDTPSTQKAQNFSNSARSSNFSQRVLYGILIILILFVLGIAILQTRSVGDLQDKNNMLQTSVVNLRDENSMLQATIESLRNRTPTP